MVKGLKKQSQEDGNVRSLCNTIGQWQHRSQVKLHVSMQNKAIIKLNKIKEIPKDEAVQLGAEFLGESILLSVGVALTIFEYTRSTLSGNKKAHAKKKVEEEYKEYIETRLKTIEDQLKAHS